MEKTVIKIDKTLLDQVVNEAKESTRLRKNHNFHTDYADPINRMLNAMEPGTYARPHKHEDPDKREAFFILRGRMAVIIYNEDGTISDHMILDAREERYGVEIPPKVWHSVISLESGSVVYEIKDGPYFPMNDKNFASWAPAEGSDKCQEYIDSILKQIS